MWPRERRHIYVPVDPEEFCGSKLDYLRHLSVRLVEEQPTRQREDDAYITISGFQNICQRAARMLDQAQYRIYMTGTAAMLELFREKLEDLVRRQIKVVLITERDLNWIWPLFITAVI